MSYYDEDFYNQPSIFEQAINEFKTEIMSSIKEEFLKKMKKLEEENHALYEVRDNFEKIKKEYDQKLSELERKEKDLKRNIRREKINELFEENQIVRFSVMREHIIRPKCDKCDSDRKIHFKTPLGKDSYEKCECSEYDYLAKPVPMTLIEFSIRNGNGYAWYQIKQPNDGGGYLSYYEASINGSELISTEDEARNALSNGWMYRKIFATEELAQFYCDLWNSEEQNRK